MANFKYEEYYQEGRNILGEPFPEFVTFFDEYDKEGARVLDVGCGQGRDALFIARLGHRVVGVDLAPTGIEQMLEDAEKEALAITGVVADITEYSFEGKIDVAVIDRTLHMIPEPEVRHETLLRICNAVYSGGHVLIADEKKNLPAFKQLLIEHNWEASLEKGGFLFMGKG